MGEREKVGVGESAPERDRASPTLKQGHYDVQLSSFSSSSCSSFFSIFHFLLIQPSPPPQILDPPIHWLSFVAMKKAEKGKL